jgi:hypothetical protein
MEFNPGNNIVRLCLRGMELEDEGKPDDATGVFLRAWNEAANNFEKYLAAYFVARHQKDVPGKLKWLETSLQFASKVNDLTVEGAFYYLYLNIAKCYEELGDPGNSGKNYELAMSFKDRLTDTGPFYHGTKADLKTGDMLTPGGSSNYKQGVIMNHIYFTASVNGAGLAAALAKGEGRERVYIVEPTGSFENDPNVTDKKFPGNPTRSYRTREPLRITGEVTDWVRQTPGQLQQWRDKLASSKGDIIN